MLKIVQRQLFLGHPIQTSLGARSPTCTLETIETRWRMRVKSEARVTCHRGFSWQIGMTDEVVAWLFNLI